MCTHSLPQVSACDRDLGEPVVHLGAKSLMACRTASPAPSVVQGSRVHSRLRPCGMGRHGNTSVRSGGAQVKLPVGLRCVWVSITAKGKTETKPKLEGGLFKCSPRHCDSGLTPHIGSLRLGLYPLGLRTALWLFL